MSARVMPALGGNGVKLIAAVSADDDGLIAVYRVTDEEFNANKGPHNKQPITDSERELLRITLLGDGPEQS